MREREPIDQPLRDLIEIIHFTENVSTKIHGLLNEAEIYNTIRKEFANSERYTASILLLTDDGSSLKVAEAAISPEKLKAGERASGLRLRDYQIDLNKSRIYSQVVKKGKTVQVNVNDIVAELFPRPLAALISKTMGYEEQASIITPLKRHGEIIGAFAISSTALAEHLIPSVRSLARHISAALELVEEQVERRQVETALRESEERYRSLFERVPVGLYRTTQDGQILDANPAQVEMFGYPDRESALEANASDSYIDVGDRKRWQALIESDGVTHDFEVQMRRRDGKLIWVQDRARAIRDSDGRVLYYEGSMEDITERKQAESALGERMKELTCLYAVHRDMHEALPLDKLCWRVIEHLGSAMQFPEIAVPVIELYGIRFASDKYTERLSHGLHAAIRSGGETCGRLSVYYAETRPFSIPDEQNFLNAIAEALGLWLERKQAERALRKSEGKLRAQYESIPVPTYTWQRVWDDIVLVDYNDAAMAATQGKIADFVGIKAREMYHDMLEVVEELTWCFTQKSSLEREMFYRFKTTGERKYLAVKYAFVPPDLVSVYTEDITERKRMEQYILRAERLAAMGHMATTLAHEIQNPLQAIQSHLELVRDFDLEPDEHEEYLHFCCQEIERLTEVTERVLGFARPAKDTLRSASITHLMERALAISKPLRHPRVQVAVDIPADLPPVLVIPDQIVQVLLNLIINAIEAIPDSGHVRITAHIDEDREDKDMVVLTLTNDGPPIPPEHIEHLFDPFFTTKPGGTGLGLFVSHNIIEQHGGMISVENLVDSQGVTFGIALPIARPSEGQEISV